MVIGRESTGAAKIILVEHENETEMMNDFAN
jgi:hypothetical protein